MKKIMALVLVIVMLLASPQAAFAASETNTSYRMKNIIESIVNITVDLLQKAIAMLTDIEDHWANDFIGRLSSMEIIAGYPDGSFQPERDIQVDEFIKLVVTAMGYTPGNGDSYWADTYIAIAKEEGLIGDKEFTTYKRPINRQEMAKIIANATLKKEFEPNSNYLGVLRSRIKDYPKVSDTHKHSVLVAYGLGLITGYPDYEYKPFNNATRAEASVVVMRFIDPSIRQLVEVNVEKKTITLRNNMTGEQETVYPPSLNPEAITVAHALIDSLKLSTGYITPFYSGFNNSIETQYYKSKETFEVSTDTWDPSYMQMAIGINVANDEIVQMHPYNIVIWKTSEVREQHNEVVRAFLSAIFKEKASIAIEEYERYMDLALKAGPAISIEKIIDDRSVHFFKEENSNRLSVSISAKGIRLKQF